MTDYWPQEEGAVFDAEAYILPCYPEGGITELSSVKPGASTTAGRIDVVVSAALGDGIGVALKTASSGGVPSRIPILFYGAMKVTFGQSGTAVTMGAFVMNCITTAFITTDAGTFYYDDLKVFGGSSYVMGMTLQACAAGTDEGLILVGKTA